MYVLITLFDVNKRNIFYKYKGNGFKKQKRRREKNRERERDREKFVHICTNHGHPLCILMLITPCNEIIKRIHNT